MKILIPKIKPSKLTFKDLKQQFNYIYPWLEENDKCCEFILSTPPKEEQDIVIYSPGQTIPGGKGIYQHFTDNGYELIENPHPSILTNAMKELTDEKLDELGLPNWCSIILPTKQDLLLPNENGNLCFLYCYRGGGRRGLDVVSFLGEWSHDRAFLLARKSSESKTLDTLTPSLSDSLSARVEKLENIFSKIKEIIN